MKKIMLILLIMMALMAIPALAILDADTIGVNITFNLPTNNSYNSSGSTVTNFLLNVSVSWQGVNLGGATTGMNMSNSTFIFTKGTNVTTFYNNTASINGTKTTVSTGDFYFNISYGNLSEGTYDVHFVIYNETTAPVTDTNQINSSKIQFTVDRSGGSVVISNPYLGSTVVPNANTVAFDYVPTEPNLGNCSIHLNNRLVKETTSGTITPNVTSGLSQRFTHPFPADNSSVRVAIRCTDLAGNPSATSQLNNFTFNVLIGGVPPAVRQQLISGAGGGGFAPQKQQPAFSGVNLGSSAAAQKASTHLQTWAWAYAIVVIGVLIYAFRKKFK